MLKARPKLINSIEVIGHLIIYVLDIYNFLTFQFLSTYYHYTKPVDMYLLPPLGAD